MMALRSAVAGMWHVLSMSKAVRTGLVVVAASVSLFLIISLIDPMAACNGILETRHLASTHQWLAYGILFVWSFCLFLTVMPLGTVTILLSGFLLGPVAGGVQFAALVIASAVLYEFGKESDPETVVRRFEAYPSLARVRDMSVRSGKWVSGGLRLVPVVPSAVASLTASFLGISWKDFMIGTIAAGWVRPIGFAVLGSLGQFAPICGIGSV